MSSATETGASGIVIRCETCGKAYKIHPEKLPSNVTSFPCRACGSLVPILREDGERAASEPAAGILVVVEEAQLGKLIQRILSKDGYSGRLALTGQDALRALEDSPPDLAIVSVYLPDMMGFELLDRMTQAQSGMKIPTILLSAVHHAARYKRAPTSLYGADDYLERHHLPDLLLPKIRSLLSADAGTRAQVTPTQLPAPTDEQVLQRRDLESMERSRQEPADPKMEEIKRMCRVIAGDIALYNEDVIGSTPPEELLEAIAPDLREGESLLSARFPDLGDQAPHLLRGELQRLLSSRGIEIP